jgi:hypothetical protein
MPGKRLSAMTRRAVWLGALTGMLCISAARAEVVISAAQTKNINCANGLCAPTGSEAVLNVGDLENLLTSGNVTVTTTGSAVQADDIRLAAPLSWPSDSTLELDAYQSIAIHRLLSVKGKGGLSLVTNDGGSGGVLYFGPRGRAHFARLLSPLSINGTSYTLVGSVKSLAAAVAAAPSGFFALAHDYDAGPDGAYGSSPVPTDFTGTFNGMGNTIANLTIIDNRIAKRNQYVGLFSFVDYFGSIADLKLGDISVTGTRPGLVLGGLAGFNGGNLMLDSATGSISESNHGGAGGLVGSNTGNISDCFSGAVVRGEDHSTLGGLVAGTSAGTINSSFANGQVGARHASQVGGLVGLAQYNGGEGPVIINSYATGAVSAKSDSYLGGFVGYSDEASIGTSYSTGAVMAGAEDTVGGFAGYPPSQISDSYWDTTTSGMDQGSGLGNVSGLTGLTTEQFQSGLPTGFDPTIWGEKSNINNGFPYLLANPPK